MSTKWVINTRVSYADVDRREVMLLGRVFKLLQEAAIEHANAFGTGTEVRETRSEGWVLNRIAASIERYPAAGEPLRLETWSTGIKGFKGIRDFRVYDAAERIVIQASSLWLYINVATKSLVRVPTAVAETFPVGPEPAWCPELETLEFERPAKDAAAVPVTLRYSDFDVNEHVNNAAYFDLVQTALAQLGQPIAPRRIRMKFAKAIPAEARSVAVRVEARGAGTRFGVEGDGAVFAFGEAGEAGGAEGVEGES